MKKASISIATPSGWDRVTSALGMVMPLAVWAAEVGGLAGLFSPGLQGFHTTVPTTSRHRHAAKAHHLTQAGRLALVAPWASSTKSSRTLVRLS